MPPKNPYINLTLPCPILHLLISHFQVVAVQGRARTARMTLPHFTAETPMFMPVGTQGEGEQDEGHKGFV
jgi:hypothetical protein